MGDPIYWTDAGAVMLESALSVDFLMNNGYYKFDNNYLWLIERTCQLNSGLILFSCEKNRLKQQAKGGQSMPQTVEAFYHDRIVELKHKPVGIQRAKALVVFLDAEEAKESHAVDLKRVRKSESSVDKWIGVIEGVELGNWKTERRAALERRHREGSH